MSSLQSSWPSHSAVMHVLAISKPVIVNEVKTCPERSELMQQ